MTHVSNPNSSIFKALGNASPSKDEMKMGIAYVHSLLEGCARGGVHSDSKPVSAEAQNLHVRLYNIGTQRLENFEYDLVDDIASRAVEYRCIDPATLSKHFRPGQVLQRGSREYVKDTVEEIVLHMIGSMGVERVVEKIGKVLKGVMSMAEENLPTSYAGAVTVQAREQVAILYALQKAQEK